MSGFDNAYESCTLCPRRCAVNRAVSRGFCGGGVNAAVTQAAKHYWEEPVISGKNGSGAVFFSGCSMRCVYCQNYEISRKNIGKELTDTELAEVFLSLENDGAENINLVNSTHFAPSIRRALLIAKPKIPVVWNSGGYELAETLEQLDGLIDVYLPDFKYRSSEKAVKYSSAPNYPDYAIKAINEMYRQTGTPVIENGLIKRGVIVRHLILPSYPLQSIKALFEIKEKLPSDILVSLMSQYFPTGEVSAERCPELNRRITHGEYRAVLKVYEELGFSGFTQELSSASEEYVPKLISDRFNSRS